MSIKSYDWYPFATYWNMSFIIRKTSHSRTQCLITDHATHSGLFYAPWKLTAQFIHGTRTGWFSHQKQKVESAEQSQSPFPREKDLVWREWGERRAVGAGRAWLLPLKPLAPFHKQGLCRWATPLSCASPPDTGFVTAAVLKWFCVSVTNAETTQISGPFPKYVRVYNFTW